MTDQPNNSEHQPAASPQVEPAPDAAPKIVADELFAHGLLTYLHTDTPHKQGERVGRLMAALDSGTGVPPLSSTSYRFPIRSARGWLALAACVTLAAIAVFVGFPGERSAQAEVQQTIAAMRSTAAGDRRYEIRLQRPTDDALPSLPGAVIDTRSPNLLLLRANAPDGHEIIAGRDATGDWCIRLDSGVEREHPEQAWPRWAKVGEESLLVDSVDRLLEELTRSYDLQREGEAKLEGSTVSYRHIVGTKKRVRCPGGDHVEVWIDATTKSVERIEMRWDPRPDTAGAPARGPEDQQNAGNAPNPSDSDHVGDHPDRRPEDGPLDRRPPPRRPGPDGPDDDRNGPDDQDRPEGFRPNGPPGDGNGPDNGPAPRDRRPPHPRPDGFRPDGQRPDGPRNGGPGMGGPGLGGPGLGGPGTFPGDRPPRGPGAFGPAPRGPGPGVGPMRNPPKKLVMQRVDAPAFDAAWFTPEGHAK